jgi:ATP-binding cassette subfamily B protein
VVGQKALESSRRREKRSEALSAPWAVFEGFAALTAGRTAIMISHRLGAARLADRILVLRDGRIVEDGHHDTLIAAGGEYAKLFAAQARWYR